jgi:hypothetical protein
MSDEQQKTPEGEQQQQQPEAGAQQQQEAGSQAADKSSGTDDLAAMRKQLLKERADRRALESKLSEHERNAMTDQEKAVAAARDEGRAQALSVAGKRLAAAEFRAAAAGKVPNIDAILEMIDPSKFIDDQGEPDLDAIAAMVTRLAAAPERKEKDEQRMPANLSFPSGVRDASQNGAADTDWLRSAAKR